MKLWIDLRVTPQSDEPPEGLAGRPGFHDWHGHPPASGPESEVTFCWPGRVIANTTGEGVRIARDTCIGYGLEVIAIKSRWEG